MRASSRAVLLLVAVAGLLLLAPAQQAQAHSFLTSSNPADGQTVAQAPRQLQLSFSELVVVRSTTVELTDATGQHLAVSGIRLAAPDGGGAAADARGAADTEDLVQLVADLPPLQQGSYRVHWRTLSADDLHRTEGVLAFGVGVAVSGT